MKSFGVRLTAGVVTILFGAYAAVLAQKDKQNDPNAWTAKALPLAEPAMPISGIKENPWGAERPSTDSQSLVQFASGSFESNAIDNSSVQLVQHTEDVTVAAPAFDMSELPASLGAPQTASAEAETAPGDVMAMPVPDWSTDSPNQPEQPPVTATQGTLSMTFPDSAAMAQPAATPVADPISNAGSVDSASVNSVPVNSVPVNSIPGESQNNTVADYVPAVLGDPSFAMGAPDPGQPSMQTGSQPEMAMPAPMAAASYPGPNTNEASVGDGNSLRANAGNSLRSGPASSTEGMGAPSMAMPAMQSPAPNLAQNPPAAANALAADSMTAPSSYQNAPYVNESFADHSNAYGNPSAINGQSAYGNPNGQLATDTLAQQTFSPQTRSQESIPASNYPNQVYPGQASAGQATGDGYPQPNEQMASLPQPGSSYPAALPSQPQAFSSAPGRSTLRNPAQGMMPSVDPATVIDSPGDRRLEGMQSPSVVIQKKAPAEVQVGKPASFVIQVQNVGSVQAYGVTVHDRVPAGMRLVDASPQPIQQGNLLMWQLGDLPANDERTVTMQLVPETEGELGSVARVSFEAAAAVRTIATKPVLQITQRSVEKVLIGQQLEIELDVANTGTGDATGISLEEDVPDGLEHPQGRQLDNLLGTIPAGSRQAHVLRLRAVQPGMISNTIRLVSEDGTVASHTLNVEVVAPELQVRMDGPSRKYLERPADYAVTLMNSGTADATNVELSVGLDRGFTFMSTDYEGYYDQSRHVITWSLEALPVGMSVDVPIKLLPIEEGQRALTVDAKADLNIVAKAERAISVEGFATLSFSIDNPGGPIEVGAESDYQVTIVNDGSKMDSNIRLQVQLPPGLELVSADAQNGDASMNAQGIVTFPTLPQLTPGSKAIYQLRVRGRQQGTHLVRAIVASDASTQPVTKEESTLVYSDR